MTILPKICSFLFLTLLLMPVSFALAEDKLDSNKERLEKIEKQIEETIKGLKGKQTESGALSQDLGRLDVEVRRIERLEKKSNRQLAEISDKLDDKRRSLKSLKAQMKATEEQVRHRLVVLYKSGEVGLIKALLSESESPRDITEKYAFLSRMVRHDRELLSSYRQSSIEHSTAVDELETLQKKQSELVVRRRKEQNTLKRARKSKKVLLATVKQDAQLLEKMLKELRAKAARLNDLVKKLETEQTQSYSADLKGLLPYKGRLTWPVNGKLRTGFGKSRHGDLGTLIESHGFDIEADVGSPVSAVAGGKIIFAKSLRGYGRLMIVDHGNKYYTLYAHVAKFTRKVGDFISAGDVVAYSGFEGRDAVYFEVRQGGKPLDPGHWLKKR